MCSDRGSAPFAPFTPSIELTAFGGRSRSSGGQPPVASAIGLALVLLAQAGAATGTHLGRSVSGAGTTMVEGGTGAPSFTPVPTKVAFHWNGETGRFECLALAPSAGAGAPGSGDFDTNVMYVTGVIASVGREHGRAVLEGSATVTTFREILLDGRFDV